MMRPLPLLVLVLLGIFAVPARSCGPGRRPGLRRRPAKLTPLVFKQHIPNVSENTIGASGEAEGRIRRRDESFNKLVANYNPEIIFKDDEGTEADRMMSERCKEKIDILGISVLNQWPGVRLRVTEGWDEDMLHAPDSLHYEGRAVDITTSDRDRSKLGMLARLAVEAGFDWVYYESRGHIHCSVKADSSITVRTGGCFSGDSKVTLSNGSRKSMKHLKPGDNVQTSTSDGKLVYSDVILMLDNQPDVKADFRQFRTERGNTITLTSRHLMFVVDRPDQMMTHARSVLARNVKPGQYIFVANDSLSSQRIESVTLVSGVGLYAPLTSQGTIVVDDVVASCYGILNNHDIAHFSMWPVRVAYYLGGFSSNPPQQGIHWYAGALHSISPYVLWKTHWS